MPMNAASLNSKRLRNVLKVLQDGRPHTTREIVRKADVMAVSACVAELREHGAVIHCSQQMVDDKMRFFYTMLALPTELRVEGKGPMVRRG